MSLRPTPAAHLAVHVRDCGRVPEFLHVNVVIRIIRMSGEESTRGLRGWDDWEAHLCQ